MAPGDRAIASAWPRCSAPTPGTRPACRSASPAESRGCRRASWRARPCSPLRIRHPEVARGSLLHVPALLWPTRTGVRPSSFPMPVTSALVVGAAAVAVELEEVVEDPLDVVEGVRTVRWWASSTERQMSSAVGSSRIRSSCSWRRPSSPVTLVPRRSFMPPSLTKPLAQPDLRVARHLRLPEETQ